MQTLRRLAETPLSIPAATSWYLADVAQALGKQELFTKQSPQKLKVLREHALIESAVSSNRIEGVEVDQKRIGTIVFGKSFLRDGDEEEVRGYRKALDLIHTKRAALPISEETIRKLHSLSRGAVGDAGVYKQMQNDIIEVHPNGRRDLLYTLIEAYREFERRAGETASPRGSKTALIHSAIDRQTGAFQAADLQRNCPGVGIDLIRSVLKEKRRVGQVDCVRRGPKSLWRKTDRWNLGTT